ncbi:MAG: thioredoxin family protein [Thermoplasmata archaeon]|nr:thioredoxin family protein [Thermoplasmata archaeon]
MAEIGLFDLHPGDPAPRFSLPDVEGVPRTLEEFQGSPYLLVVFWCNHCPYVQAWEQRMIDLATEYQPRGVQVVLINANDGVAYPDDRMSAMVERARLKHYPFPYLRDESQAVAHAYGARVTPHPMLFGPDRRLLFQGRIDDRHDAPERVQHRYLREALDAVLAGKPVAAAELPVLGCSVKWKP